jgi:hypothetical protein
MARHSKSGDGTRAAAGGLAVSFARLVSPVSVRSTPARDYMRWRMYTAYGDAQIVPPADDIVRYARWAVKDS